MGSWKTGVVRERPNKPFFMSNFFDNDFFPELSQRNSTIPVVNIR